MNPGSIIARAVAKLTDNESVKKASSILSDSSWRVNQILTPESLKTIEIKEIRHLFIKVALRQINSVGHDKEVLEMERKVKTLENRAIGGGWL